MYIAVDMKTRKYDMGVRQAAKSATRDAIIRACIDSFMAERSFNVTLAAVAERTDVTVKTVLRHFGSREALVDAAWSQLFNDVVAERTAPPGDPRAALSVLIAHYERRGITVLAMLAAENDDPRARRMGDWGRMTHRAWVEEVFAPNSLRNRQRALACSTSSWWRRTSTAGSYCDWTAGYPSTTSSTGCF